MALALHEAERLFVQVPLASAKCMSVVNHIKL